MPGGKALSLKSIKTMKPKQTGGRAVW